MPTYRVEISPNNRAGCKNKDCKDAGIKILRDELRFGTWMEIVVNGREVQSWSYKHWGCVTPAQIENLSSVIDGDVNMFDGYEELPTEDQDKVKQAIEQGHVDDEDWRGDVEFNRPGMKGMHARTPKRQDKENEGAAKNGGATDAIPAKPTKKRGRPTNGGSKEEQAPAAAKKAKKKPDHTSEQSEDRPASQKTKSKKAQEYAEEGSAKRTIKSSAKHKSKKESALLVNSDAAEIPVEKAPKKEVGREAKTAILDAKVASKYKKASEASEDAPKESKKAKKNMPDDTAIDATESSKLRRAGRTRKSIVM